MFCLTLTGIDLRDGFESVDWLDAVALVGQEPKLFSGTVRENIAYGCKPPPSDAEIAAYVSEVADTIQFEGSVMPGVEALVYGHCVKIVLSLVHEALDALPDVRASPLVGVTCGEAHSVES